jgi:TetR/AcrR family transcriptional regulator, cholesterol catabolism regulator
MSTPRKRPGPSAGAGTRRAAARKDSTESYEQRRREIAVAAARVFHRMGYRATTISAVAQELGTDRASLYYYVSSKEELFDEVVREVSEANVALAEQIQSSDVAPPEKLRQLIEALMASYAQNFPLLYVYILEDLAAIDGQRSAWSRHMRSLNRRYDAAVTAIVQEGLDAGTLRAVGSARTIAFGIIGMVGWTSRWFDPTDSKENAASIGSSFAAMVIEGLESGRLPTSPTERP